MVRHLSVRLCWHDGGWNGSVCNDPRKNIFCVDHDYIREKKNEDAEIKNRGLHLSAFPASTAPPHPPCHAEISAFSKKPYPITFSHPLKVKHIPTYDIEDCTETLYPYSVFPAPYAWLGVNRYDALRKTEQLPLRDLTQDDRTYADTQPTTNKLYKYNKGKGPARTNATNAKPKVWIDDAKLQGQLLNAFWDRLEEHKSFIVFYTNAAPVIDSKRIIVGIGRLKQMCKLAEYGSTPQRPGPNYVWQRQLLHNYPAEGFRLPYQEYLEQGIDTSQIVLCAPESFEEEFKYVAEHVSDGGVLAVLEQMNRILDIIQNDIREGRFKSDEDWARHQIWVQQGISELWKNRGKNPGIGSVLYTLGFTRSMTYHQEVLAPMENDDSVSHVSNILDGEMEPEEKYARDFDNARSKWRAYARDPEYRKLLVMLMRLEISADQAGRIINQDKRRNSGMPFDERSLADNPYLIAENDEGEDDERGMLLSEPISLDIIDQAMCPLMAAPWKLRFDDDRRIRAIMIERLAAAAEEGDTLLSIKELLGHVRQRFPGERSCEPDPYLIQANTAFYEERLCFLGEDKGFAALREIAQDSELISQTIRGLLAVHYDDAPQPDWSAIIEQRLKPAQESSLGIDIEQRARTEKRENLEKLFKQKFAVLTGRAGTGKTTELQLFIQGIIEQEKQRADDILVLAPTGKARVRIARDMSIAGIMPQTIHQHLNKHGWLDERLGFQRTGGTKTSAKTIILDECSMIPEDLLATFFRSIEFSQVRRFVMVGDPNQLPPIGPGRPFDDIIEWLDEHGHSDHHAKLQQRMRQKSRESACLQLADGFLREEQSKDIEDIYRRIATNDLEGTDLGFEEWTDQEDLLRKLDIALKDCGSTDYDSYRKSLGITDGQFEQCEAWQVLSPTKHKEISGTMSLNSYMQRKFVGHILQCCRTRQYGKFGRWPAPFGKTKDVVHHDKVIQIRNTRRIKCWPPQEEAYVANGEIGIAIKPVQIDFVLNVQFSDQPTLKYSYYNNEAEQSVETNLELAYAITIHKAQGSDFGRVILVIPSDTFNLSIEMLYTALTRSKERTVLLVQGGVDTLQKCRQANKSDTGRRNTSLFSITVRDEGVPYAEYRIHRTKTGIMVRSKSEVIIANELVSAGIALTEKNYERRLTSRANPADFKLPDFSFTGPDGREHYWEHLGMLMDVGYRQSWERKKKWYEENGYMEQLIISQDGSDGSIDAKAIAELIRTRVFSTRGGAQ